MPKMSSPSNAVLDYKALPKIEVHPLVLKPHRDHHPTNTPLPALTLPN
jgi:hypothetical protein